MLKEEQIKDLIKRAEKMIKLLAKLETVVLDDKDYRLILKIVEIKNEEK